MSKFYQNMSVRKIIVCFPPGKMGKVVHFCKLRTVFVSASEHGSPSGYNTTNSLPFQLRSAHYSPLVLSNFGQFSYPLPNTVHPLDTSRMCGPELERQGSVQTPDSFRIRYRTWFIRWILHSLFRVVVPATLHNMLCSVARTTTLDRECGY